MQVFRNVEEFDRTTRSGEGVSRRLASEAAADEQESMREAVSAGESLLTVLGSIPGAVVAAAKAEVERLKAIDPAHPRLGQATAAVQLFGEAGPMIERIRVRAARAVEIARSPVPGVYGFVELSSGKPAAKITVGLREGKTVSRRTVTAADGYFFLALAPKVKGASKAASSKTLTVVLSDASGRTLHEDPVVIAAGETVAYREYAIELPVRPKVRRKGR